jgi:AraC family transcriptional regulator
MPVRVLTACANDQGLVDYVASLPVTELGDIPPRMVGREVPAQTYAVFELHGLSEIHSTYHHINEWFPTSGYEPGNGPDFELYPQDFNPEDPQSRMYIYFPVKTG